MRSMLRFALGATAFALCSAPLDAQGSLSLQGFGYPGGQLSTRAMAAGGALADFDAQSPLNPASLALGSRASVYLQYDPEFRTVTSDAGTAKTTTARFPLFAVSGRMGRATFGLSFSSFLDRSWTNTYADTQLLNGERIASTLNSSSKGGINDARASMAWIVSPKLHLGIGVHVFPGENRLSIGRSFDDTTKFGVFVAPNVITYTGTALSLGFVGMPLSHLNVAGAVRLGGMVQSRQGDSTVLGNARIPGRFSGSIAYDGIPGAAFAVRYAAEKWTDMRGLGSASLPIFDATDVSVGGEVSGPKLSGSATALRFGWRSRQLPFGAVQEQVKEQSYSAGVGLPVGVGRTMFDLALQHAHRTAGTWTENGWVVSVGLSIRP